MIEAMKPSKVAMVFDWDDVVFNTAAFKKSMAGALSKRGIPRSVVLETVGIAKDGRGYNPRIHARMIKEKSGQGHAREMEHMIWEACRALSKKLLFPDAVRLIRRGHEEK